VLLVRKVGCEHETRLSEVDVEHWTVKVAEAFLCDHSTGVNGRNGVR
jgi:hypothetical protein